MTEEEQEQIFDNFQAIAHSLPDSDRKRLFGAFVDVLQAKITTLNEGWESPLFTDDAGNFSKDQAFLGVFERGAKKRAYQEIIDIIDQIIHPPAPPEG